ncbi:unnamed protein product [Symbiodinium sp. CCMP2592]|nr:unnamed protein product [Symbiodinium sp. CCMP2592]
MDVKRDTIGAFVDAQGTASSPDGVPLRSTVHVVEATRHSPMPSEVSPPLSAMWESGAWIASPSGGLSWVLLACFVLYNCCQLLRHLRKGMPDVEAPKKAVTAPDVSPPPPSMGTLEADPGPSQDNEKKPADNKDAGPGTQVGPSEDLAPPSLPSPPSPKDDGAMDSAAKSQELTAVEVEALRELKQSLQDVKMWVEDSAHAAASRTKEHLAATLQELQRVLDDSIYSQPRLEAAMPDAFEPLQAKLMPSLHGIKSTLGPYPEHGADIRALREVILATEDFATRALKAVEDTAWDQNGRLNALGTQVGTIGTDISKGLQHAHRKLDSIHQALGNRPGNSSDGGGNTLVSVKDLMAEMKALNQNMEALNQNMEQLQTKVQYVEGRMETALTKLVVVEQSTNRLAAARPKAPPPSSALPSEEAPLPPPTQPPGQWQPPSTGPSTTTPARTPSIPAPTMRLAPQVQLLQPGLPGVQAHGGLPMTQIAQPVQQPVQQQTNEMVNLVWNGQVFPVPAAAVQHNQ